MKEYWNEMQGMWKMEMMKKKKKPKKVESNKENYIDDIFFAKFILFTFPSFCFLLHIIFSFHFYFFHFTPYGLKLVIFFVSSLHIYNI